MEAHYFSTGELNRARMRNGVELAALVSRASNFTHISICAYIGRPSGQVVCFGLVAYGRHVSHLRVVGVCSHPHKNHPCPHLARLVCLLFRHTSVSCNKQAKMLLRNSNKALRLAAATSMSRVAGTVCCLRAELYSRIIS